MTKVYIYVVARDLGFAPNPFHGFCTLATCKPKIRNTAKVGDWIFGVGGGSLKATGRCIFAMRVSRRISFNEYWEDPAYNDKKSVRNGSKKMMLGDNIYFYDNQNEEWHQASSHHSNPDGTMNHYNLERDTKSDKVLISDNFYYFGSEAPIIPDLVLNELDYRNGIGHRNYSLDKAISLIKWLESEHSNALNKVISDPFNFDKSAVHYSVQTNRMT